MKHHPISPPATATTSTTKGGNKEREREKAALKTCACMLFDVCKEYY